MSTPVDPRSNISRRQYNYRFRERLYRSVNNSLHDWTHLLNDINRGYCIRLALSASVVGVIGYIFYYTVLMKRQERKPLAQRWRWCAPTVEITLLEKTPLENSSMVIYRFALPHSYDYAGYSPVSSVLLISPSTWQKYETSRWYTPISHPEQRGVIEFAVNLKSGKMSKILQKLNRGDVMQLGRWMKEFRYESNALDELGVICSTSGASIALQLMNYISHNTNDKTKLKVLYCHHNLDTLSIKHAYFDKYVNESKGQISVKYNILTTSAESGKEKTNITEWKINEDLFTGLLNEEIISATMPAPVALSHQEVFNRNNNYCDVKRDSNTSRLQLSWKEKEEEIQQEKQHQHEQRRTALLICGPPSLLMTLCGGGWTWKNYTYNQNKLLHFSGILPSMGYTRSEIYKFGIRYNWK